MPRYKAPSLFAERELRDLLANRKREALVAVADIPPASLLDESADSLAETLQQRYALSKIGLTEGAISVKVEEIQVDVAGSWERDLEHHRGPFYVPGSAVTFFVPFTGDRSLFRSSPSIAGLNPPRAELHHQELRYRFERADDAVDDTQARFADGLKCTNEYIARVNVDVEGFNRELTPALRQAVTERVRKVRALRERTAALGFPGRDDALAAPRADPATTVSEAPFTPAATEHPKYDVALSFAGEQRPYVEQTATELRRLGIAVFYDDDVRDELWGKNLVDHLGDVYQRQARFVVMFISAAYVAKAWPTHERRSAQARALVAKEEYILPVRFDDTIVPGMTDTVAYVDARKTGPATLATMIQKKITRSG